MPNTCEPVDSAQFAALTTLTTAAPESVYTYKELSLSWAQYLQLRESGALNERPMAGGQTARITQLGRGILK